MAEPDLVSLKSKLRPSRTFFCTGVGAYYTKTDTRLPAPGAWNDWFELSFCIVSCIERKLYMVELGTD